MRNQWWSLCSNSTFGALGEEAMETKTAGHLRAEKAKPGCLSYSILWLYCPWPLIPYSPYCLHLSWLSICFMDHCSENLENDHWRTSTWLDCLDGIPDQGRGTEFFKANGMSKYPSMMEHPSLFQFLFLPLHVQFWEKLTSRKVTTILPTTQ